MARPGRKRGQTDSASMRDAILDSTIAILATSGFSATSARAVADDAGIAPGGIFYHFGSMDDLMAAAFDRCNEGRIDRLRAALDHPTEQIPAALADAARHEFTLPESRALLELVVGAISSPSLAAHVRDGVDQSIEFTQHAIRAAIADTPLASALPIDLIAELAASSFFGLEVLAHLGRDVDHDALARLIRLVTALLAPTPPG